MQNLGKYDPYQALTVTKMTGFKTAMIIMFKEPKETMPKELKEDMMMMFHQMDNTSEVLGVMKKTKWNFWS